MINSADLSGKLALDANGLNGLKQAAKENSPEAIKGVAKQFEAIFMNMMLKSMREASPQDGAFDSEQSRQFTSMLDQQLSNNLASKGLGLADVLAKQLSKTGTSTPLDAATLKQDLLPTHAILNQTVNQAISQSALGSQSPTEALDNPAVETITDTDLSLEDSLSKAYQAIKSERSAETSVPNTSGMSSESTNFQRKMASHAEQASRDTGIPAEFMLGQAALETGWGKREIKAADGSNSHNLFGIKAGSNWKGKVAEATTTEYINGVKQKRIEKFRAYDSYADSFKDFANMISSSPRYDNVMDNLQSAKDYSKAIQSAGYATDPHYASKLNNVIQKIATNNDEA